MTGILILVLFVIIILAGVFVFNWLQQRVRNQKNQSLIRQFQRIGEKRGLAFSSQEVLSNKVIGLDGLNRKFVVVNENGDARVIPLNRVRRCVVEKSWVRDSGNDIANARVSSIHLRFDLSDQTREEVVFYDHGIHCSGQQQHLENRANDWKAILSKLTGTSARERA